MKLKQRHDATENDSPLSRLKMQQYEIFQSVLGIKPHDLHSAV